ncbi:class I SAM-dependent methyltransferase [Arthrobacter sp. TMN-37]
MPGLCCSPPLRSGAGAGAGRPGADPEGAAIADKYSRYAPFYDLVSGEFPVYRAGRKKAIALLAPPPGAQVLDVGCGTGLNFALLQARIGPAGTIVGIDSSPGMLRRARRRAERRGWTNVILLEADATASPPADLRRRIAAAGGRAASEAAIATYALSLMPDREQAWAMMRELTAADGALAVLDMQEPTGVFTAAAPLARIACRLGGADISARPWTAVERDLDDVRAASARGGHLQIRAGCRRPGPDGAGAPGRGSGAAT